MIKFDELRNKWNKDPEFRTEFEALRPEFELARKLIEARVRAGMSQSEVSGWGRASLPSPAWKAATSRR